MATGQIGTRDTKVGDVLKYELEPSTGYTRIDAVVTLPAGGLSVGAVLESTSVAGKFTLLAVATTSDADGVLIDSRVADKVFFTGGDFTLAVLVRGPAIVNGDKLTYNADIDTGPEILAAEVALLANTNIVVQNQV